MMVWGDDDEIRSLADLERPDYSRFYVTAAIALAYIGSLWIAWEAGRLWDARDVSHDAQDRAYEVSIR